MIIALCRFPDLIKSHGSSQPPAAAASGGSVRQSIHVRPSLLVRVNPAMSEHQPGKGEYHGLDHQTDRNQCEADRYCQLADREGCLRPTGNSRSVTARRLCRASRHRTAEQRGRVDCLEWCRTHSRQTQSAADQASSDRTDNHHRIDRKHQPEVRSVGPVGRCIRAHHRASPAAREALERGRGDPGTRSMRRLRSAGILDGKECPRPDRHRCETVSQWRRQDHRYRQETAAVQYPAAIDRFSRPSPTTNSTIPTRPIFRRPRRRQKPITISASGSNGTGNRVRKMPTGIFRRAGRTSRLR